MTDAAYRAGYDRIIWKPIFHEPRAASPVARGQFPCPQVISDTMEPTEHIDGKFYTSKSKFREVTKANGCIEVGNDPARLRPISRPQADPAKRRDAINKAIAQAGL